MKHTALIGVTGFILAIYIIGESVTEANATNGQLFAALGIFLMLFMIKNMQKA